MAIANITNTTLISQPRENIFRLLNDRTNVPDPIDDSGKRKFVYTREPNHKERSFAGYPYVIVRDPTLRQDAHSVSRATAQVEWEQEVEIQSSDVMSNSTHTGRGLEYLNDIVDDIVTFFGSAAGRKTLRQKGHFNVRLQVDRAEEVELDTENAFRAVILITYSLRVNV